MCVRSTRLASRLTDSSACRLALASGVGEECTCGELFYAGVASQLLASLRGRDSPPHGRWQGRWRERAPSLSRAPFSCDSFPAAAAHARIRLSGGRTASGPPVKRVGRGERCGCVRRANRIPARTGSLAPGGFTDGERGRDGLGCVHSIRYGLRLDSAVTEIVLGAVSAFDNGGVPAHHAACFVWLARIVPYDSNSLPPPAAAAHATPRRIRLGGARGASGSSGCVEASDAGVLRVRGREPRVTFVFPRIQI
ncbi:hypothetical protein B0H11DRAFT_1140410 [Mycena galericulata]|nr:hypothetical protein B0H11DRAFT_1140410 [Mycena galericulata]